MSITANGERVPMLRQEKEIKDPTIIDSVIRSADVCRLAMCANHEPYLVPMCFGYDGDLMYFHCAREGKKIDIIRKNEKVCFELEGQVKIARAGTPCNWSLEYTSIIGFGRASIVENAREKRNALDLIMDHYEGKRPYEYSDKAFDKAAIIKVKIDDMTCKREL